MKKIRGFTLIELMIAVAIVGILAGIAYPAYLNSVTKTRRTDCQGVLSNFAIAMERYFAAQDSYKGAAAGGGDTGAPAATTFPSQCPLDGNTKYYNITIAAADENSYTLRATPFGPQGEDGIIELKSNGQKGWDRDNSGSVNYSTENSWQAH